MVFILSFEIYRVKIFAARVCDLIDGEIIRPARVVSCNRHANFFSHLSSPDLKKCWSLDYELWFVVFVALKENFLFWVVWVGFGSFWVVLQFKSMIEQIQTKGVMQHLNSTSQPEDPTSFQFHSASLSIFLE